MGFVATLLKAISWSLGTGLIVLNYHGCAIFGNPLSFLAFSLIVGPAVVSVVNSIVTKGKSHEALYWIVLLSISLRLIPPLGDGGSAFMIHNDAMYDYQVADIIAERGAWVWGLETERAVHMAFFPALYILSVQLSTVTGLALYQVCRFFPVLLTAFTVIFAFKIYSLMLGGRAAIAASFLFSVCYKYNWFDGFYVQETLGILFFVLAFYCVIWAARRVERPIFLIFLSSALLVAMTHFFSSLMLGVALVLCYIHFRLMRRVHLESLRMGIRDVLVALVPIVAWLSLVGVAAMYTGIQYAVEYSNALLEFVVDPFERRVIPQPTGIHLAAAEAFLVYLGFLLAGGVGLLGVAQGIRVIKRAASDKLRSAMAQMMIFCAIAFLFGGLAVVGIFLSPPENPDIPSRLVTFVFLFWSPAFGVGLLLVGRRTRRMRFGKHWTLRRGIVLAYLCLTILLVLPAFSTWLLMPSYVQGPATLDDAQVRPLSLWLRTQGDKSAVLIGDPVMALATSALARRPLQKFISAGLLYYGSNMTSQLFPQLGGPDLPVYLLINEVYLSHKYYSITWVYESKAPPTESDITSSFNEINSYPSLNKVYCSPAIALYYSPN